MKLLPFLLPLLLAVPAASQGYPKTCDSCEDLPSLMKELKEQEWLRDRFYSFSPWEKVYPFTAGSVKDLQSRVQAAFNAWLKTPAGGGGAGEPTMGTNPENCQLVFYVKGADGNTTIQPYDEKAMKQRYCKTILDYMLAHEASHQRTCRALGAKNKAFLNAPDFVAADEVKAYEAGIKVLEKAINDLAARCKEKGTTAKYRLDPNQEISPAKVYQSEDRVRRITDMLERAQKDAGNGRK
jgi:hypothetical protein